MNTHTKEIFADYEHYLRKFRKKDYIQNMELFRAKWNEILAATVQAGNYEEVAKDFVEQLKNTYKRFGKVSKTRKIDLGLFLIYFVFPGILLTEKAGAKELCDILADSWNEEMGTCIEYLSYDEIVENFNDKTFGMF